MARQKLPGGNTAEYPGEPALWLFIAADVLLFSFLFLAFLWDTPRGQVGNIETDELKRQLLGLLNTLLLVVSSWCVASAINAARFGRTHLVPPLFSGAILLGAGFVSIKILEYSEKVSAGVGLNSGDFFMYYFAVTGLHLFHVIIGMVLLSGFALHHGRNPNAAVNIPLLEGVGVFWHVVDLLWIFIFAIFYMVI